MNHNYIFYYRNVYIRQIKTEDLEKMRIWRNDISNAKYLRQISHITKRAQKQWFLDYLQNDKEIGFSIVETEDICEMVGSMFLYNINDESAEFGKILIGNKKTSGKKVGLNAVISILFIAFNKLKLKEVFLFVNKDNVPAVKTYTRAGFSLATGSLSKTAIYKMIITKDTFFERYKNDLY